MGTILGTLQLWIKEQVSSQLKSPKTKSELVKLAFKVESTSGFRSSSMSNIAGWENQMPVRDVGKSIKLGKCSRNDYDRLAFPIAKTCRDEPREGQGQRDFLKIKCYNYGQVRHIKSQYPLPNNEAGKV